MSDSKLANWSGTARKWILWFVCLFAPVLHRFLVPKCNYCTMKRINKQTNEKKKCEKEIHSFDMKLYEIIGNFSKCLFWEWASVCVCVYLAFDVRKILIPKRKDLIFFSSFVFISPVPWYGVYGSERLRLPQDEKEKNKTKSESLKSSRSFRKINQMRCWENKFNRFFSAVQRVLSLFFLFFWLNKIWTKLLSLTSLMEL